MHRLIASILDVSNEFHNKNVPIHKQLCFSPPTYYLYWFGRSYPNVTLNNNEGPFCIQSMNGIQGTNHLDENWIDSLMQWSQFFNI